MLLISIPNIILSIEEKNEPEPKGPQTEEEEEKEEDAELNREAFYN